MKLRDGAKIEYTFEHTLEDNWYSRTKRLFKGIVNGILEKRVPHLEGKGTQRVPAQTVDRRTKVSESSMGTGSNEAGVDTEVRKRAPLTPDPWDYSGDWNDWAIGLYYESRTNSGHVEEGQSD